MLALKSAAEELKEKFFANMSQRAKDAFIEEMQFLGAVKVKDVEGAQRKIVEVVQSLAEQGVLLKHLGPHIGDLLVHLFQPLRSFLEGLTPLLRQSR